VQRSSSAPRASAAARFATTHWSIIAAAGGDSQAGAREALELLCRTYWPAIYAHVRRSGRDPQTAQDLTQAFFARLLERQVIPRADPERGRFRSFLLASLRNFLCNEHDRESARKRGGDRRVLPIAWDAVESRYGTEPGHRLTPERAFERQWALTVLEQALTALESQYRESGKHGLFEALAPYLTPGSDDLDYCRTAAQLGLSEAATKMAASRLRRRYRELIREEIARTVADPAEIEDELRSLFAALAP
jgi:RNA polymerase sigma-70 factor (ECF subfamily)